MRAAIYLSEGVVEVRELEAMSYDVFDSAIAILGAEPRHEQRWRDAFGLPMTQNLRRPSAERLEAGLHRSDGLKFPR